MSALQEMLNNQDKGLNIMKLERAGLFEQTRKEKKASETCANAILTEANVVFVVTVLS